MNNKKFYTDPNGYHIYPEKSFDELIEEAKSLGMFPTKTVQETPKPRPQENEVLKLKQFLENAFDY